MLFNNEKNILINYYEAASRAQIAKMRPLATDAVM